MKPLFAVVRKGLAGRSPTRQSRSGDGAWVELEFPKRVRFSTVYVSFQTLSMAAAGYSLAVPDGDGWQAVVSVEGNSLRRRVHRFDGVEADRLRLTIVRPCKQDEPVRVCEIRVYNEADN